MDRFIDAALDREPRRIEMSERCFQLFQLRRRAMHFHPGQIGHGEHFREQCANVVEMRENAFGIGVSFTAENFIAINAEAVEKILFLGRGFHEVWALKLGTRLETRPRYTPTTCFETFPFPEPSDQATRAVSAAAKELSELRENWLNPPEWTLTRELIFSGSIDGPWARFVHKPNKRGIGTVRYPRVEPRDEEAATKLAKRTLTNLYNERPAWLAHAHAKLDAAVAAAYGFPADLRDEAILEKLLALNLQRSAAERSASSRKPRSSRQKTSDELI
jgi:hypothetical protein